MVILVSALSAPFLFFKTVVKLIVIAAHTFISLRIISGFSRGTCYSSELP